ncbi:MAG: RNA 2',3'-cyclic phosphodiesterase [Candidatus Omnitrophica bacterium]|nr:RNA 2',3'-cyclic phosphodiesterase [Candidatus Omnitrophota bacterium]
MHTIRAFIAVELEAEIKDEILRIQDILKTSEADVKWVKPENLHITLKFLGNVQQEKIEKIKDALIGCLSYFKPFSLKLNSLGIFPKIANPRVIWINAVSADNALEKLAASTEAALVSLKFPKEKRTFKSHITLGRVRSNRNREKLSGVFEKTDICQKEMMTEAVSLFKSALSSAGPHYEVLSTIKLG